MIASISRKGKIHILHIEFETDADSDMPERMLEYFGILYKRHKKPIISLIVCPFKTNVADSPLRIEGPDEEILVFRYRVARLWQYQAQKYLEMHNLGVYSMLPTMLGADYTLLSQALDEMKDAYEGQTERLQKHVLWFGTFLQRSNTVSPEDKRRIREKMSNLESLLDENPFVQKRREEGREEGRAEGEAKGKQKALMLVVEGRFPQLTALAQQKVERGAKPDALDLVIKGVAAAPDEATAKLLLNLLAA